MKLLSHIKYDDNYSYNTSHLKQWMDAFYSDYLGSDSHILDSDVTYYTRDTYANDDSQLGSFDQNIVSQKVFALDAMEASAHKLNFGWDPTSVPPLSQGNAYGFWTTAACSGNNAWAQYSHHDVYNPQYDDLSYAIFISWNGGCESCYSSVSSGLTGARPAFWISLD